MNAPTGGANGPGSTGPSANGQDSYPDSNPLLAAGLGYAARKWGVVAMFELLFSGPKPHCSCKKLFNCPWPGKHPRYRTGSLEHGANSATTDPRIIRSWWNSWSQANVGLATGRRWDLLVLDIDPRNGGDVTLAELEDRLGKLPHTVESLTGGGGRHLLFRHPPGKPRGSLGAGIEILSDGKLFVAPPSMHHSGRTYAWELSSVPGVVDLAELPDTWIGEILLLEVGGEKGDGGGYRDSGEYRGASPAVPDVPIDPEDPDIPVDPAIPAVPVTQGRASPDCSAVPAVPADPAVPVTPGWTVDRVIQGSMPKGPGEHDRKNMDLARGIRVNLGINELDAAQPIFERWFEQARACISDKDYDLAWFKFMRAFELARIPLGARDLATRAYEAAKNSPFPTCVERVRGDRTKLLVAICAQMHFLVGGRFKLSCHQVADLLHMHPSQASALLHGLTKVLILRCVDRGRPGTPGRGAATWEYIGDRLSGGEGGRPR